MCAQDVTNDDCNPWVDEQVVLSEEDVLKGGPQRIRLYANCFSLPCPKVGSTEFSLYKDHRCQDMADWDISIPASSCAVSAGV